MMMRSREAFSARKKASSAHPPTAIRSTAVVEVEKDCRRRWGGNARAALRQRHRNSIALPPVITSRTHPRRACPPKHALPLGEAMLSQPSRPESSPSNLDFVVPLWDCNRNQQAYKHLSARSLLEQVPLVRVSSGCRRGTGADTSRFVEKLQHASPTRQNPND